MTQSATTASDTVTQPPGNKLIFTLATGAGLSVASLYYSQPMLNKIGQTYDATIGLTGLIPTLTQIGYALGILFLVPLGDRYDRRNLIFMKSLLLALALLLCALAPNISSLLLISLAIGILATMAQDIVPASAALAPLAQRGRMVGTVMTGLLVGILLSRVVAGLVTQFWGWQSMYLLAAASLILIGWCLRQMMPRFQPDTQLGYRALMGSLITLWRRYPALRRATLAQGLLSVAFSAFWSTLAIMLNNAYQLDSGVAGAFGLAGAAGALAAPLAGRLADQQGSARVTQGSSALVALAFALMFLLPILPLPAQLGLIVISAILFDFGVQAALIAHQTLVYGLEPPARGRLNALLFTGVFIGMAAGSALGSQALAVFGWPGVITLAMLAGLGSLLVRLQTAS